ncbi:hypothetical protein ACW2Q0_06815 [Nocardia sp. R16R-3T]
MTVSNGAPEVGPILERERRIPLAIVADLRRPIPLVDHQPPRPPTAPPQGCPGRCQDIGTVERNSRRARARTRGYARSP